MKVAHVTPSFHPAHVYGGPTYSTFKLCSALARAGCDIRVLTTDANGLDRTLEVDTAVEAVLEPRLSVHYCHRIARHSVSPALIRALPALIEWADVVHLMAVYSFPTIPTLLACRIAGKPTVWSPRGALQRWEGTTRRKLKGPWDATCRAVAPRRLALHVTSAQEADQSRPRFPHASTIVIPNGVDLPDINATDSAPILRLLYLGRLDPIKGIENLLAACGKLAIEAPALPWNLTIAGDGEDQYRRSLRRSVEDLSLSQRVSFVGHTEGAEKKALFNAADVTVVPSHSENFGIVVAESLAYGVPVIAGKGTPWSRMEEVGCGLWVANDAASLAQAIKRMHGLPRAEMGAKGRRWMEAEFSWARVAELTIELYRQLLAGGPVGE